MKRVNYTAEVDFSRGKWRVVIFRTLFLILLPFLIILSRLLRRKILFGKTIIDMPDIPPPMPPQPPRKNDDELSILR